MQPSAGSQLRAARIGQRHSKTRSTRLLVVLCAAAAAGLSQMGGRGAYYKAKYGGGRGRAGGRKGGRGGQLPPPPPGQARGGTGEDLRAFLRSLERQSYGAYQELRGTAWTLQRGVQLKIDQCQKDAFAPPSRCRVVFEGAAAQLPNEAYATKVSRIATGDWISRKFFDAARSAGDDKRTETGGWGGKKGGELRIAVCSQFVLERTACLVDGSGGVEVRFTVALPASGRSIEGIWCARVLCERALDLALKAVVAREDADLARHIASVIKQRSLRDALAAKGLVAFIGDGALLARRAGNDDRPMVDGAVAFDSKKCGGLRVELNGVTGLGLPLGLSLICGGGFHGKSTLLQALQVGCFDKVPGDGRELCVSDPNCVKVRAEDGRSVQSVDISSFIGDVPGRPAGFTRRFSTSDASGSTSQAAAICEAVEAGATTLLFDEDTCATNFMIRDERMARLVADDREPIVPFVRRAAALSTKHGVSSILVLGGTGDYFSIADAVVVMDAFSPRDATADAKALAGDPPPMPADAFRATPRTPKPGVPDGRTGCKALSSFQYGDNNDCDVSGVEQLVEVGQTRACCAAIIHAAKQRHASVASLLDALDGLDLDAIQPAGRRDGDLSRPRRYEVAAALNRLRTAKFEAASAKRGRDVMDET